MQLRVIFAALNFLVLTALSIFADVASAAVQVGPNCG
jgi:hypothetical protein